MIDFGIDLVPVAGCRFTIELEGLELGGERNEDLGIAETLLGGVLDGFLASRSDDVDLWMRFLVRQWERIEIFVLKETAIVSGRARLCPSLHQHVHGFAEAVARETWIDRVYPVFHAGPEWKRTFDPATRQHIEHGVFFRQPVRIRQRNRRSEQTDLGAFGAGRQSAGDDCARRHQAVKSRMMLIHHEAVVSEVISQNHLVEILAVKAIALGGIKA